MGKRKTSRHRVSGDPRMRAAGSVPDRGSQRSEIGDEFADLLEAFNAAADPIELLSNASSMISVLDLRHPDLTGLDEPDSPTPEEFAEALVRSGEGVALGWVMAELLEDEMLQVRMRGMADLDQLPSWVLDFAKTEVVAAWQAVDTFRETVTIVLAVRAGSVEFTAHAVIDLILGDAMVDGFLAEETLAEVEAIYAAAHSLGTMLFEDLALPEARAWLEAGIDRSWDLEPDEDAEQWPDGRPLVEWLARRCPPGGRMESGRVPDRPESTDVMRSYLEARAAQPHFEPGLQMIVLGYLLFAEESREDLRLISPARVEIYLLHWLPDHPHFGRGEAAALVSVLADYIRYAHARLGIAATGTQETLDRLEFLRPDFEAWVKEQREAADSGEELDDDVNVE